MTETIRRAITRWGKELHVERDGESMAVRGFLQPLTAEPPAVEERGAAEMRRYRYLGPSEPALRRGDVLCDGTVRYFVCRADTVFAGGIPTHCRAVLRKEPNDDGDGTD